MNAKRTELTMPRSVTFEMAKSKAVISDRGDEMIDLVKTNIWR
jgi:hypothetical protein